MVGIHLDQARSRFIPHGFPPEIMEEFERRIGRRCLGNKAASGTEIIQELGDEHMRTGSPIVYTSADSVFQVAAHEEVIPLWELYKICETAREILRGPARSGPRDRAAVPRRARPFHAHRQPARLRRAAASRHAARPAGRARRTRSTAWARSSMSSWAAASRIASRPRTTPTAWPRRWKPWRRCDAGLIFVNLVDFDQQYGHRNDVEGYGAALEEFDAWLPRFRARPAPRRPRHFHRRSRLRPDRPRHRPHPRVRSAAGLRAQGARAASIWVCARRCPISARPWPPISASSIANGTSFLTQIL